MVINAEGLMVITSIIIRNVRNKQQQQIKVTDHPDKSDHRALSACRLAG
jgi:hypothetical protein